MESKGNIVPLDTPQILCNNYIPFGVQQSMKRLVILTSSCLLFACILIGCQSDNTQTDSPSLPEVTAVTAVGELPQPEIIIEPSTVEPDRDFMVSGVNFPSNQVILLYISESDINLGPAFAQETIQPDGTFSKTLTAPITWPGANLNGKSKLKIVIEDLYQENLAAADFILDYSNSFKSYVNEEAGYSVSIPVDWESSDPQQTPLGELILLGKPPIDPGNPGNSKIISASTENLTENEAAQLISCGAIDCNDSIQFSVTTINGLTARHTTISSENTPEIEWYFITFEERLIYFTLQDPLSLLPLDPMINSFQLQSLPTDEETVLSAADQTEVEIEGEETPVPTEAAVEEEVEEEEEAELAEATELIEPTAEVEETVTVSPTVPPTEEAIEPTEAVTTTPLPTAEPTATSILSEESEEEEATRLAQLPDPMDAGPMQTVINLLTILSRLEEDGSTFEYFAAETRAEFRNSGDILPFIRMSSRPLSFELLRLDQIPVTIEASVRDINGRRYELEFVLQKEDDRWRILSVRTLR